MPRLFTALEIPASVAENLARLRGGVPNARWIDVENYHITLRFIGDVDDTFARDAANAFSLRRVGLPPETRKFTPHVTLARLRSTMPREVADFLADFGHFPSMMMEPDRFVLFSSRDSVGGGPYVVEEAYPLM